MDYPGFGLSEGLHGYIPSFDRLVDDVIEQYSKIKGTYLYILSGGPQPRLQLQCHGFLSLRNRIVTTIVAAFVCNFMQ